MRFDVGLLRYLEREDFRVLNAIEQGMRNHEVVPTELIAAIAGLKSGGQATKILGNLLRMKLIYHEHKMYDGYRLTYPGYDFLALKAFVQRGTVTGAGRQIGVGKESDIYLVNNDETGEVMAIKLQRLGRVSFRSIKRKRDYLKHRRSASWLYLSRLASVKEYAYMKALYDAGYPVPRPIDYNRHAIVMSLAKGHTLSMIRHLKDPAVVFDKLMDILIRFTAAGLVHGDFNEFNIMVDPESEDITVIDFPQMVSTSHPNAAEFFDRDVECLVKYFRKRFGYVPPDYPTFASIGGANFNTEGLDKVVEASGYQNRRDPTLARPKVEGDDSDAEGVVMDVTSSAATTGSGKNENAKTPNALREMIAASIAVSGFTKELDDEFNRLYQEQVSNAQSGADDEEDEEEQEEEEVESDEESGSPAAGGFSTFAKLEKDPHGDVPDLVGDTSSMLKELALSAIAAGQDPEAEIDYAEDGENEDEDEEEEEEESEDDASEEESEDEESRQDREYEEALRMSRPPDGVRTRASGRRIVPRSGEAYLRLNEENRDRKLREAAEELSGEDIIKRRVAQDLEKKKKKAMLATVTAKALKGKSDMKNKEKIKAKEYAKDFKSGGWW